MSKAEAELRRANEELTSACRQLEEQNQRLREQLKRRAAPKAQQTPVTVTVPADVPGPGAIVHYVDKAGHVHNALVLQVLKDGMLKLKVFRQAVPDLVIDVRRGQGDDEQRSCWRTKGSK